MITDYDLFKYRKRVEWFKPFEYQWIARTVLSYIESCVECRLFDTEDELKEQTIIMISPHFGNTDPSILEMVVDAVIYG